jgi:hypothetical protein
MKVRFEVEKHIGKKKLKKPQLVLYNPDGTRFLNYLERAQAQWAAEQAQRDAEQAQRDAEQAQRDAEQVRDKALAELASERETIRLLQEQLRAAGIV